MVTDPISDYLTRLRNAISAKHKVVEIPASNLKKEMTKILMDQGFILNYKVMEDNKQGMIKIALKYNNKTKESSIMFSLLQATHNMEVFIGIIH